MRADWEKHADSIERSQPRVGRFPISGLVRRARRINDMSQRQMATMAQVAPSTVGKVESGAMVPSLDVFQRLIATTGLYLVVVDQEGRVIQPMRDCADTRDGAERRYPSHLDTILDPAPGEWWADQFGLARPPETFYRDREMRDAMRARSQWEVRVAKLRHAPEPPRWEMIAARLRARLFPEERRRQAAEYLAIDPHDVDVDEWPE